jgi:hypothetical protein
MNDLGNYINENILTAVSIIWVIYIFLYTETDKQINELFRRLKFTFGIHEGVFNLQLYAAEQHLGIPEVFEHLNTFPNSPRAGGIKKFKQQYKIIERIKVASLVNLFLLSLVGLAITLGWLSKECWISWGKIHTTVSLIFSLFYYYVISNIQKIEFTRFLIHKE